MSALNKNKTNKPIAIILNGTSSVGKSSVAKNLQSTLDEYDFLLLGIDNFVNMLPNYLVGEEENASQGFKFVKTKAGYDIEIGEIGNIVIQQMHEMANKLLLLGRNIIIDHVMLTQSWDKHLEESLDASAIVLKVLLKCELSVLEKRELQRKDRRPGLASQLLYVENNMDNYSVGIDTTNLDLNQITQKISQELSTYKNQY